MRFAKWTAALACLQLLAITTAGAANAEQQAKALQIIGDFADRMCSNIPLVTSNQTAQVEGKISVELAGLAKKLSDIGINGTGKLSDSKSQAGILPKDLATALKSRDDCKFRYLEKLQPIFLPTTSSVSPSKKTGSSLPGSYPDEIWRAASKPDYAWLVDEWCFTSLPGFYSRFRLEGEKLFQQNEATTPPVIKTEWVPVTVHKSNRNVLRLAYPEDLGWLTEFIHYSPKETAEWTQNERYVKDDGSVSSGENRQVLSCGRCTIDKNFGYYTCKG